MAYPFLRVLVVHGGICWHPQFMETSMCIYIYADIYIYIVHRGHVEGLGLGV